MLKHYIKNVLCCMVAALLLVSVASCSSDDGETPQQEPAEQTLVMFFPWSNTLLDAFRRNVSDFSTVVAQRGLHGERVVVFMATSAASAVLFELHAEGGRCVSDTLRRYQNAEFCSRASLTRLFSEIRAFAPANRYGMVVGCHGMAWVPVSNGAKASNMPRHYNISRPLSTRYMGGLAESSQIETTDFAAALEGAGMKMEYILFDNCYMSSVEVAYELKDVVRYIVASPTEIMSYGFPYSRCGADLLGNVDYRDIVDKFIAFYSYSYATVAVIDCAEMAALAEVVKRINDGAGDNGISASGVQTMDGYNPPLFLDFGDYTERKASSDELLKAFREQLSKTVVYSGHTANYYSSLRGVVAIERYSGLNTSEPSVNSLAAGYRQTAWYKATH